MYDLAIIISLMCSTIFLFRIFGHQSNECTIYYVIEYIDKDDRHNTQRH